MDVDSKDDFDSKMDFDSKDDWNSRFNPWDAESIYDFMYINCPECEFKSKEEAYFQVHALQNHPESCKFFGKLSQDDSKQSVKNEPNISCEAIIKEENDDDFVDPGHFLFPNNECIEQAPVEVKDVNVQSVKEEVKKAEFKGQLKCVHCGFTNHQPGTFQRHVNSYMKCKLCAQMFCGERAKAKYNAHMKKHEKKAQSHHQCNICFLEFKFTSAHKRHLERTRCGVADKPINCPYCGLAFDGDNLRDHMKVCNSGGNVDNALADDNWCGDSPVGKWQCYFCGLLSQSQDFIEEHVVSVHQIKVEKYIWSEYDRNGLIGPKSKYQCHKCKVCFGVQSNLELHICGLTTPYLMNAHRVEPKAKIKHTCYKCNKSFVRHYSLLDHRATCEGKVSEKKVRQCYFCGFMTEIESEIRKHIETLHDENVTTWMYGSPKKDQCNECKVVFLNEGLLKSHICGVTNPSIPFNKKQKEKEQCTICGQAFTTHRMLANHFARYHTKEADFICDLCGKKFFSKDSLSSHKNNFHGEHIPCDKCGKLVKGKSKLRLHMRKFHGTVPFSGHKPCEQCGERFPTKTKMRHHKLSVHGIDLPWPFKCSECKRGFDLKGLLKRHLENVHNIKAASETLSKEPTDPPEVQGSNAGHIANVGHAPPHSTAGQIVAANQIAAAAGQTISAEQIQLKKELLEKQLPLPWIGQKH